MESKDLGVHEQDAQDSADADRIFSYDPFEDGVGNEAPAASEKTAQGAEDAASAPETEEAAAAGAGEAEAQAGGEEAAEAKPASIGAVSVNDLAKAGDALRKAVEGVTQSAERLARPQPQGQGQQQEQPLYALNITDDILGMIVSQDPQQVRQALNTVVNGLANMMHRNIREEYRGHVSEAVQSYVARHADDSKVRTDIFNDFYTTYPQLNDKALLPMVARAAQEEMASMGDNVQWSPAVRDKIGQRVLRDIAELAKKFSEPAGQQGQQVAAGAAAALNKLPTPTKLPQRVGGPKQVGGSVRQGAGKTPSRQAEDIADTLFGVG